MALFAAEIARRRLLQLRAGGRSALCGGLAGPATHTATSQSAAVATRLHHPGFSLVRVWKFFGCRFLRLRCSAPCCEAMAMAIQLLNFLTGGLNPSPEPAIMDGSNGARLKRRRRRASSRSPHLFTTAVPPRPPTPSALPFFSPTPPSPTPRPPQTAGYWLCPNNCMGRGSCRDGQCECQPGYTYFDCSLRTCAADCSGNGMCFNGTCHCKDGFCGADCSAKCCPNDCSGHGECAQSGGKGVCRCEPGFSGADCRWGARPLRPALGPAAPPPRPRAPTPPPSAAHPPPLALPPQPPRVPQRLLRQRRLREAGRRAARAAGGVGSRLPVQRGVHRLRLLTKGVPRRLLRCASRRPPRPLVVAPRPRRPPRSRLPPPRRRRPRLLL